MSTRSNTLLGLGLNFCLAVITCYVSNNLNGRFQHRGETIEQQFGILAGESYELDGVKSYFPEFQNRVMFPLVLKAASEVGGLRPGQWYLLLRFATGLLAFFLFWKLLTQIGSASYRLAAAGMGLLAYALLFTYNHGWEHPSDFIDVIFFTLLLRMALTQRPLAFWVVTLLACANRESAAFAGVIWFFLYGWDEKNRPVKKHAAFGVGVTVGALIVIWSLRYLLGGEKALTGQTVAIRWLGAMIHEALHNFGPGAWPVLMLAMFGPIVGWIVANRATLSRYYWRLAAAGGTIALISGTFSIMKELRTFIPAMTVLVFVGVVGEARRVNKASPKDYPRSEGDNVLPFRRKSS